MDSLNLTASIIAILQLTSKIIAYIDNVKDASSARAQWGIEASNLSHLLMMLRYRLEQEASNELWLAEVHKLGETNGILDQYRDALERLEARILGEKRIKKAAQVIMWKFIKADVEETLDRIERLKPFVQIALQVDHL